MKTYTLADLKKTVRSQGFKMAALRAPDGTRIVSFNKYNPKAKDLDAQFKTIETRLKSGLYPDGIYYVLLAHNIVGSKNPLEFPIAQGKLSPSELAEFEKKQLPLTPATIVQPSEQVLSWDSALKMQQEISDLKNKVNLLELEKKNLLEQIAEMEAEEDDALAESEVTQNPLVKSLADLVPTLASLADRYFESEDKKIELERLKIQNQAKAPQSNNSQPKGRRIVPIGSREHLQLIENLYNEGNDEALNEELDKLQAKNPALYDKVCKELDLFEEEEPPAQTQQTQGQEEEEEEEEEEGDE